MSKPSTDYASELHDAVKLFIDQPLNNPLTRSQIMDIARIALPVLEQKQRSEGEWIEWGGGEQPLQRMDFCEIRFRNGEQASGMAYYWVWNHSGENDDIIAYKVMNSRQQPVKPKRGGGF
ncbi:hypothetical protein QMZ93_07330 [Pantoea stewartii subsp. indologenes]|uniref:hypothetical protein n=1 Tax=Pantoea stewartii TaxID=66269 RepID=UPI0024DFE90F|nr:hypothetical protein [Pantoea stewartii]MDK2633154.1 hypothetical protein [Pantoea stewartii subsp. indologenes]